MEINLNGLPTAIYSNRLYRVKGGYSDNILLIADRELTTSCCHHPLRIVMPYKLNDNKYAVGYGSDPVATFYSENVEEAIAQLREWVKEKVVFDFSDETSEYHSWSYFDDDYVTEHCPRCDHETQFYPSKEWTDDSYPEGSGKSDFFECGVCGYIKSIM
jgi:hypothetical protein